MATFNFPIPYQAGTNVQLAFTPADIYDYFFTPNNGYYELQDKNGTPIYGGSGNVGGIDGTNATAVLRAALINGGKILAKDATYPISGTSPIFGAVKPNTYLFGQSWNTVFDVLSDVNLFNLYVDNLVLRNFTIKMAVTNTESSICIWNGGRYNTFSALNMTAGQDAIGDIGSHSLIEDCRINGAGRHGIMEYGSNAIIRRNYATKVGDTGIGTYAGGDFTEISNCVVEDAANDNFCIVGSHDVVFTDNVAKDGRCGLYIGAEQPNKPCYKNNVLRFTHTGTVHRFVQNNGFGTGVQMIAGSGIHDFTFSDIKIILAGNEGGVFDMDGDNNTLENFELRVTDNIQVVPMQVFGSHNIIKNGIVQGSPNRSFRGVEIYAGAYLLLDNVEISNSLNADVHIGVANAPRSDYVTITNCKLLSGLGINGIRDDSKIGTVLINNLNYNPVGQIMNPIYNSDRLLDSGGISNIWVSGVTYVNIGSPKTITVSGGQISQILVNNVATTSPVTLNPLDTISIIFSVLPTITVTGM